MRRITIAGRVFEFERAELVAYHCAGEEADWNLELRREGASLVLAGTMEPGASSPEGIEQATLRLDARALDEVAGDLIGNLVTLYPREADGLEFRGERTPGGVRLAVTLVADWDAALASFERPGDVEVVIDVEAEVGGWHPGRLPR